MKKLFSAVLTLLLIALCLPVSACSDGADFTLKEENGEKYYSVKIFSAGGDFVIPAYYGEGEEKAPVKEIEKEGFAGTSATKITVPATVEKIGVAAFAYNNYLKQVVFEEGSSLKEIPRGAFGYCRALEKVNIPDGVKSIGVLAFIECGKLKDVNMPASLESIGDRAFESCLSLSSADFKTALKSIGDFAFYRTALTEIKIPDGAEEIGRSAFHTCEKLETAVIGAKVKVLKSGVFGYCISLKEIYLPAGLEKIEGAYYKDGALETGHAFHSDKALQDVFFAGSEEDWEKVVIVSDPVTESSATFDNSAIFNAAKHFSAAYGF